MTFDLFRWLRDRADERRAVAEYRLAWRQLRAVRHAATAGGNHDEAEHLVPDYASRRQEKS